MRPALTLLVAVLLAPACAEAQEETPNGPQRSDTESGGAESADAESADADDPRSAEARALFQRGRDLARERRYSEAAAAFVRSLSLVERPSARFNLAVCFYVQDQYVQAAEHLGRYLDTAVREEEGEAWDEALEMITHARRSVSELVVEVLPRNATLTIDGNPVEGAGRRTARLNPGPHVVRVEAEGHAAQLATVETSPGETLLRTFTLESNRARPRLSVRADPTIPIRVDGRTVGRGEATLELEPGSHEVAVGADLRRAIELDWNEHTRLELTAPAPAAAGGTQDDTLLWAALGGGAAAVVLAVVVTATVAATTQQRPPAGAIVLSEPTLTIE